MEQTKDLTQLVSHIQQKLIGNSHEIKLLMTALIAKGHVLLEDNPGSGKTALAKALSESLSLDFKRLQCTPDLLPSDLTGLNIYQPDTKEFAFMEGPIFTEILLTDELNRATPRTQSALLEAMAENQVTIDGNTRKLPPFFYVIATQNPLESQGTFPLPEAQLDRFLLQFSLPKLQLEEKLQMIQQFLTPQYTQPLTALFNREDLEGMRTKREGVVIHPDLRKYLVDLCQSVGRIEGIKTDISNRGLMDYVKGSQAYALLSGRNYVVPEDIQELAVPILAHRLYYRNPMISTQEKEHAVLELLKTVPVPTEDWQEK